MSMRNIRGIVRKSAKRYQSPAHKARLLREGNKAKAAWGGYEGFTKEEKSGWGPTEAFLKSLDALTASGAIVKK
jgi:hypothetical protein